MVDGISIYFVWSSRTGWMDEKERKERGERSSMVGSWVGAHKMGGGDVGKGESAR